MADGSLWLELTFQIIGNLGVLGLIHWLFTFLLLTS